MVDSYGDPILALTNFKPGLYDLLLLNIKMPNMNGFDLYEKMREIDRNAKICFITASELFYEEYLRLGGHVKLEEEYFIQKPCKSEKLICQEMKYYILSPLEIKNNINSPYILQKDDRIKVNFFYIIHLLPK